MEQESKDFFVKSKIYIPGTRSNQVKLVALKYIMIILSFLIILEFLMDGLEIRDLRKLIIPIAFYLYLRNRPDTKGGLVFTPVEIQLDRDALSMNYPKIDRRDGMGNRGEKVVFVFNNITKLEYSKQLQCIRIVGKPLIQVQFEEEKKYTGTKVEADGTTEREHLLYLEAEGVGEFLSDLKGYSQLEIEYKDL